MLQIRPAEFLLADHDYIVNAYPNLTKEQKRKLKENTFKI